MEVGAFVLKIVTLSECFLLLVQYSYSQEIFDQHFEKKLDKFVQKTMTCRYIPGLTLSVVKGSKTWTEGYGTADFSKGHLVDNSTQFVIGSVTKSFTMILLGILLTEKGLDWNAKVCDILGPKYKFIDEYMTKEMTLKDLLSHRTGLAPTRLGFFAGFPDNLTREQLSIKMKYLPQLLPFRDGYAYSNFMYMYLGHITERLGGDTWENLLKSKLLLPIGMTSTRVLKQPGDLLKDNVAKPYIYKNGEYQNGTLDIYSIHPGEPAGAIISTGEDMAKYLRFNLNKGTTTQGRTLLKPALLSEAFTAATPTIDNEFFLSRPEFPISDTTTDYGYAWLSATYRGYRKIWHDGGLHSYVSEAWMFPDINAGIFANANGPALYRLRSYGLRSIMYYLSDKLIGEKSWLNESTTCEFPHLWRNTTTISPLPEALGKLENTSEYIGIYRHHFIPALYITSKPGCHSLLFKISRMSGVIHSTQEKDRLLMEVTSPWEYKMYFRDDNNNTVMMNATIERNKKGEVRSIVLEELVHIVYTKDITISESHVSG